MTEPILFSTQSGARTSRRRVAAGFPSRDQASRAILALLGTRNYRPDDIRVHEDETVGWEEDPVLLVTVMTEDLSEAAALLRAHGGKVRPVA